MPGSDEAPAAAAMPATPGAAAHWLRQSRVLPAETALRAQEIRAMLEQGEAAHPEVLALLTTSLGRVKELCRGEVAGASHAARGRAAKKADALLSFVAGASDKQLRSVVGGRPASDLETAAAVLAEVEALDSTGAGASPDAAAAAVGSEQLDSIFDLLAILDPKAQGAAGKIQARLRGIKLRRTIADVGGDAAEAHRRLAQEEVMAAQIGAFRAAKKGLLQSNRAVYSNGIFERSFYIPGVELTADAILHFKRIYAMADIQQKGCLGRRQFADLLEILHIETPPEVMEQMFREMDANHDGSIGFEEFVAAMKNNLSEEQLASAEGIKLGGAGTRAWSRGAIVWGAHSALLIIATAQVVAVLIYFRFVLVPLTLAYFFTFLLSPVQNLFEYRPIILPDSLRDAAGQKRVVCNPMEEDPDYVGERRYKSQYRRSIMGTPQAGVFDFVRHLKAPHGLSVVLALGVAFVAIGAVFLLIGEEAYAVLGDGDLIDAVTDAAAEGLNALNASNVKILSDVDNKQTWSQGELYGWLGMVSGFANQVILVLILTVYLMIEKTSPGMFDGQAEIAVEIEASVKSYISLKAVISVVTGVLVTATLWLCSVPMAALFGLLSFLLNFVPNLGSMIAVALPLPLVMVEPSMQPYEKVLAFVLPGMVQIAIGNALEPMVFGSSLNMTPIAILGGLIVWGSIWGLPGAVLSVPLLTITKILLSHANHPLATYALMLIREDPTVDELALLWQHEEEDELQVHALKTAKDIAEEGGGAESVIASYDTMGPGALQLALRALDRNIKKLQKAKPEKHAPIREQMHATQAKYELISKIFAERIERDGLLMKDHLAREDHFDERWFALYNAGAGQGWKLEFYDPRTYMLLGTVPLDAERRLAKSTSEEGGVTRYHLDVNCVISQERAHHMWCADAAERDAWYQCLQEEVGLAEVGAGSPGKRAPSPDNFE